MTVARHDTDVVRVGEGVRGRCSCKQRQTVPVETRQEAEDWCMRHLREVALAQADPGKQLNSAHYLAHLQAKADDATLPARDRALWKQLAEEHQRLSRPPATRGEAGLPISPNSKFNTGVETEPLF